MPLYWTPSPDCDDEALRSRLDAATTALGFEFYGLVTWLALSATRPTVHLVSNADPAWQAVMLERDLEQTRAIVRWCRSRHEPIAWAAPAMPRNTDAAASAEDGPRYRWSQGVRDSLGVDGMLTLSRAHPIGDEEAQQKRFSFRMLATKAHQRWLAHVRARAIAALPEPLTARETEVLRWFADGKIAEDVATLLDIKLTTVRFHATNAARKLGAENTTSATYRALVLGLLHRDWGNG